MPSRIRNLGILAHVDAGKTTVTENLLFLSGAIRSIGNVDKGTSLSDALDVERRRGISVRASTMSFEWDGVTINLIDTPGHVDFSAEVERSLRILDCAILVLSAVEGIQAQTASIWEALEAMGIPVLLFVNKVDRMGADTARVVEDLKRRFSPDVILINQPEKEGESDARVVDLDAEALSVLKLWLSGGGVRCSSAAILPAIRACSRLSSSSASIVPGLNRSSSIALRSRS